MELQAKEANGTTSKGDSNMGGGGGLETSSMVVRGMAEETSSMVVQGMAEETSSMVVQGMAEETSSMVVQGMAEETLASLTATVRTAKTGEISENELGYTLGEEPLSSGFYWDHSYQAKVTNTIASTVSLDTRSALENHQMPYIQFLQHKKDIKRRNKEKKSKKILHKGLKIFMI
ncbi:hypothetical protein ACLOAV_004673 [Pseudogymnoascus australis]